MLSQRINIPLLCISCGTFLSALCLIIPLAAKEIRPEVIIPTATNAGVLLGAGAGVTFPKNKEGDKE